MISGFVFLVLNPILVTCDRTVGNLPPSPHHVWGGIRAISSPGGKERGVREKYLVVHTFYRGVPVLGYIAIRVSRANTVDTTRVIMFEKGRCMYEILRKGTICCSFSMCIQVSQKLFDITRSIVIRTVLVKR